MMMGKGKHDIMNVPVECIKPNPYQPRKPLPMRV